MEDEEETVVPEEQEDVTQEENVTAQQPDGDKKENVTEQQPDGDKEAKRSNSVTKDMGYPTGKTMKQLADKRKKVQALNNTLKDLRCQEIFTYKNKRVSQINDDMIDSVKAANCEFLKNFNDMWGMTQELMSELQLSRIMSRELSYVPSSVVGLHAKVTRSESFEKLNSKKLPRVIVCGTEKSQMVPRIIVCEDKNVAIPGGECITVQYTKKVCSHSKLSNYTSYGGKYCA